MPLLPLPVPAIDPQRKRGFPPIVAPHTRLLLLGTLPGEQSLQRQEYYGNPQNQFWRLMSEVTGRPLVPLAYAERLDALLRSGVGLWDVVADAQRPGSLDSAIRAPAGNDLVSLIGKLPDLHTIGFNGGTAAKIGVKALGTLAARYRILVLPSSSPAHTLAYAEKLRQWLPLADALPRPCGA